MKKPLIVLIIVLLGMVYLSGCCEPYKPTKLTISNKTGYDLELVEWNGYYFDNGVVWDDDLGEYCPVLLNGTSVTRNVTPGSDYISFWRINGGKYKTDIISVAPRQQAICIITSGTAIHSVLTANDLATSKKAELQKAKNTKD